MSGGYIIMVGNEHPAEAIVATPNKKTGEPMPGTAFDISMRVGKHLILNRARVWGKRMIKDSSGKITKDKDIEFNTVGYKGEIEFMDWGKDGGYGIDIRYIPQSRSLDFEYQQNVQRITVTDQELTHIIVNAGENKFDYKKDELLIQFFKVIPGNRDSKSKNPDPLIKGFIFYEKTEDHTDNATVKAIKSSQAARNIVLELENKPVEFRNLFASLGRREEFGKVNQLDNDGTIFKTVLLFASQQPDDFFQLIQFFKDELQEAFDKAKSYKALDLTKDGFIAVMVKGKPQIVFQAIPEKEEEMVEWVIEHYQEEEVFKGIEIFKKLVSDLK